MEAAFVNLVGPGDVAVIGVNGVFGERMCDVAGRCGAEVVRVDAEWGQALDPQALLDAHPAPKVIAVVHAETSTGVRNDIEPLGAGKGDAVLLVDCRHLPRWHPGRHRRLGRRPRLQRHPEVPRCAAGTGPAHRWSARRERFVEKSRSWYLDLRMIGDYAVAGSARRYHHTAPTAMITALHAGLGALLDEGLDAAWARHAECGRLLQEGLEELGFAMFAEEGHRLPELTTAWLPDDIADEAKLRRLLLDRYDIEIGAGLGAFAGRVWRIGCMGHTARPANVTLFLGALKEVLGR